MSYIIENKTPLIQTKLTAKGRELLAKGQLDYKYWSIGDSEIDYRWVENIPSGDQIVLKPKDFQPTHKTYLSKNNCNILFELTPAEKQVVECCINNEAIERGFFSGVTDSFAFLTGDTYIVNSGTVLLSQMNGTFNINIGTTDFSDGDYILFQIAKPQTGVLSLNSTQPAILYLWYKIKKQPLSTIIELDRTLPFFSFVPQANNTPVNFVIYKGGESIMEFYGLPTSTPYWDSETLQFISQCDVSTGDVRVLNFNAVWNENMAGWDYTKESFEYFGSFEYVGQKEYLDYNKDCVEIVQVIDCEDKLLSVDDDYVKGIGVIHFTNLHISNEYGEKFHIDHNSGKYFYLYMPTIMWHRRYFAGGTGLGNLIGMNFRSNGDLKTLSGTTIEYYDLVDDPNMTISGETVVVGRVFPQLKIVAIHDEELLAAMSYKSSRNFTLPKLKGRMILPQGGQYTGVLSRGKTMYMTYVLEADNGLQYFLPHQKYIKFINNTKIDRDIEFSLESVNMLPYMRQYEQGGYDGLGFYAHRFKILCQIVDNSQDRPNPENWIAVNFTTQAITNANGFTVNPKQFEKQDSAVTGFILNKPKYNSGSIYTIQGMNLPEKNCSEELNFGDERFFFGNVKCFIGACVYRSVFKLNIKQADFKATSNPTWEDGESLFFDEVGIYNSNQQLVMISKLSRPVKLKENSQFAIELSMDF